MYVAEIGLSHIVPDSTMFQMNVRTCAENAKVCIFPPNSSKHFLLLHTVKKKTPDKYIKRNLKFQIKMKYFEFDKKTK